jgi:CRISPR-associated Csx2 family protein
MTTLISFLGKGKERGGRYRTASYRFDDETLRTVPFFGMALTEYLQPDRLILVGTSGSMWDVFFEHENAEDANDDLLSLIDAVSNNSVDDNLLTEHAGRLTQRHKINVECMLIDYARDENAQADLLGKLASRLEEGEQVAIDITHSFRHLPMLALVAARFLARVKKVDVEDIYYGALEMTDPEVQETPVIRLKGLLDMLDWVDALASYDKTGDYGIFAPMYQHAGAKTAADSLSMAAFNERINQPQQARTPLKRFRQIVNNPISPMFDLFRPELEKRLNWVDNQSYGERQKELALRFLENGDYTRAATLGFESVISRRLAGANRDPMNHEHRDAAKIEIETEIRDAGRHKTPSQRAYLDLRDLRNTLAHGSRADNGDIQGALASEQALREFLVTNLSRVDGLEN